jgi:hypothetical protein
MDYLREMQVRIAHRTFSYYHLGARGRHVGAQFIAPVEPGVMNHAPTFPALPKNRKQKTENRISYSTATPAAAGCR